MIGSRSVNVYLETSNDRSNWITLGPVIDESPVFEGQVAGGSKGPGLVVGAYMRVYVASSIVVGDGVFLSVSIDSRSE